MTTQDVYTPKEVAAILGVYRERVMDSIKSGNMPSVLVGKRYRVPRWYIDRLRSDREQITAKPIKSQ
jgi:excisionase family DNA binding protein